jgi:hypothetical protein
MTENTKSPARDRIRNIIVAAAAAAVLFGGAATMAGTAFADEGDTGGSATPGTTTSAAPTGAPSASNGGSGNPADPVPPAHAPHLDGDVSSVDTGTIMITDHDGFTRTIHLSDSTTYGEGISLPITVGEHIHAEGAVDTDGTSLAATLISVAPEPPAPGAPGQRPATPPAPPTDGSAPTPPAPPTS